MCCAPSPPTESGPTFGTPSPSLRLSLHNLLQPNLKPTASLQRTAGSLVALLKPPRPLKISPTNSGSGDGGQPLQHPPRHPPVLSEPTNRRQAPRPHHEKNRTEITSRTKSPNATAKQQKALPFRKEQQTTKTVISPGSERRRHAASFSEGQGLPGQVLQNSSDKPVRTSNMPILALHTKTQGKGEAISFFLFLTT